MLYILRHGQTDWNLRHKLQGQTDIPLNEEGRKMAVEAGKKYRDVALDICYASPLQRAYETAQLVLADRDVPIITDERLREMSFGIYEGTEEVFGKPDHPVYKLFKDPVNYVAQGQAESFEQLYDRTGRFIEEVLQPQLQEGKNILIVGHGAMNLSIINQLKHVPLEQFWDFFMNNCEMVSIEV